MKLSSTNSATSLSAQNYKDAIRLLALNTKNFPKSSNAYDSLGEAYMDVGDKVLAIEKYRTSLRLDPHNANGADMLHKLAAR